MTRSPTNMGDQLKRREGRTQQLIPETCFLDPVASGDSLSGFPQALPGKYRLKHKQNKQNHEHKTSKTM